MSFFFVLFEYDGKDGCMALGIYKKKKKNWHFDTFTDAHTHAAVIQNSTTYAISINMFLQPTIQ